MLRSALCLVALAAHSGAAATDLCLGECSTNAAGVKTCSFDFSIDIYASETGYYKVKNCMGTQPTLGMEAGVEYTFKQYDNTNHYHPLGFAYFADGAHTGVDELEPGINNGGDPYCTPAANDCMTPKYYIDGAFAGAAGDASDFGLDVYEPDFKTPKEEWVAKQYAVKLTVTDPEAKDFFYFCHIHSMMSGRVKVLQADGSVRQVANLPALGYSYAELSSFDRDCGTYGLSAYSDTADVCPGMSFVCGIDGHNSPKQQKFGRCLAAADCAMHVGMRSDLHASDPTVTFMHQMIPHHLNAVMMAKTLLKDGTYAPNDEIEALLYDIINVQNMQVMTMRDFLMTGAYPKTDRCLHEGATNGDHGQDHGRDSLTLALAAIALGVSLVVLILHVATASSKASASPQK